MDLDEGIQGLVRVLGRVAERLEEDVDDALDLGVRDNLAEALQRLVGRRAHLLVAVVQDGRERRDDLGQTQRELLRIEVRHGAKEIARSPLAPPLLVIKACQ